MAHSSELLSQLDDRVGEALRVVATYDADSYTIVSVRSNLDPDRTHGRVGLIYTNLIAADNGSEPALDRDLGPQQATVYVRERALFIRLPISDTRGVLIGVEPTVAEDLIRLIDDCRTAVSDQSHQLDGTVSITDSS